MIRDLVESKKMTIQKAISYYVSEGLVSELSKLKLLPANKSKEMCESLGIKTEDNDIYYNNFNILFDNEETHEEFKYYLKPDSLVFRLELPQMNINLWAYSLQENSLLNNILEENNDIDS